MIFRGISCTTGCVHGKRKGSVVWYTRGIMIDGYNLKLKLLLIITRLSSSGEWAGSDWFSAITVTYLANLMEVAKVRCSTTWQQFVFGLSLK